MMPVQPDFSVEARVPTYMETTDGTVATWCDLVIDIDRLGRLHEETNLQLTRACGEALLEVTNTALHPWAGATIREKIWEALDEVMERLMTGASDDDDKGQAQGLAMALAIFLNPYSPAIEVIKEEAMERWESVAPQGDSDDDADDSVEEEGDSPDDDLPFG